MTQTATVAALGAVVGYMGAEVAEETLFDRLLWPQRFYHRLDLVSFAKLAFLMPMAGPLHRAALAVLDRFRDHGLYLGKQRGDMLGTAFFANNEAVKYFHRTAEAVESRSTPKAVRNGFWVRVLQYATQKASHRSQSTWIWDMESGARHTNTTPCSLSKPAAVSDNEVTIPYADTFDEVDTKKRAVRAYRWFFVLDLDFVPPVELSTGRAVVISEGRQTVWTTAGIFVSELSSIAVAITCGLWHRLGRSGDEVPALWFSCFFCIPLFLKLIAACFTVRREKIKGPKDGIPTLSKYREIFEVECQHIGVVLVRTSQNATGAAQQFFRHYGHPVRKSRMDRIREVVCILIVYAFLLYFPTGLVLLSWTNMPMQYLWLSHQLYCVVAMHIVRIYGWQGSARTEEHVAAALCEKKEVYLESGGVYVKALLRMERLQSVDEGTRRVRETLDENSKLPRN